MSNRSTLESSDSSVETPPPEMSDESVSLGKLTRSLARAVIGIQCRPVLSNAATATEDPVMVSHSVMTDSRPTVASTGELIRDMDSSKLS